MAFYNGKYYMPALQREYRRDESYPQAQARWEAEAKQRGATLRRRQQALGRLRATQTRVHQARQALATAEQEHLTQMAKTHQVGVSYADIASALGLSKSRVHQLLAARAPVPGSDPAD
jgi:hypothetical protein